MEILKPPAIDVPIPELSNSQVPVVEITGLRKQFGASVILDDLDLRITRGEFVALLGASGSGKTTLLRILASLDTADSGDIRVAQNRAVVFQEPRLLAFQRVWKNVLLGTSRKALGREQAKQTLAEVGLSSLENRWPARLSGGEAQRVALARALVRAPEILLLDEPFASLDALTRIRMHKLVQSLWAKHQPAVLLVTHDVDEAILLADRILVLGEGRFVADHAIELPRPRHRGHETFLSIRQDLLNYLGVSEEMS